MLGRGVEDTGKRLGQFFDMEGAKKRLVWMERNVAGNQIIELRRGAFGSIWIAEQGQSGFFEQGLLGPLGGEGDDRFVLNEVFERFAG